MTIKFSEPMAAASAFGNGDDNLDLSTLQYQTEDGEWKQTLELEIEPSPSQEPENIALVSWEVTRLELYSMEIKLVFEKPLLISYEEPDHVVLTFVDEELFISRKGIKIPEEHRKLKRKLMRQLPADSQSTQDSINSMADDSKGATITALLVNLFLGFGLQQLFDMI